MVSTAIAILSSFSPADLRVGSERYASSLAQSTLLSFQYSTAEQFGGFEYQLSSLGLESSVPLVEESARRELRYKSLCQLLAETAALNLRVEIAGVDVFLLHPSAAMEGCLKEILKAVLDRTVGGIFGYRFLVRAEPIDLGFARIFFEMEVSNVTEAKTRLCAETMILSLPVSEEGLSRMLVPFGAAPADILDIDPIMEIRLELWFP